MSVQRYISTAFWEDAWVASLAPLEKYLYLYLLTNSQTNIAGVYKLTVRRIAFDTGLETGQIVAILAKFREASKAYLEGEYLVLPSWPKHQRLEERKALREGVDKILAGLPGKLLSFLGEVGYQYRTPKIPPRGGDLPPKIPLRGGDQPSYSDSDSDTDTDTDSDSDATRKELVFGSLRRLVVEAEERAERG